MVDKIDFINPAQIKPSNKDTVHKKALYIHIKTPVVFHFGGKWSIIKIIRLLKWPFPFNNPQRHKQNSRNWPPYGHVHTEEPSSTVWIVILSHCTNKLT